MHRSSSNSSQAGISKTLVEAPSPRLFEWNIEVLCGNHGKGRRDDAQRYKLYGQFVATPFVLMKPAESYYIRWTLKITEENRTITRSGEADAGTFLDRQQDTSAAYFEAFITKPGVYEQAVDKRIAQMPVSEDEAADTVSLNSRIEQVRVEELEPYLIRNEKVRLKAEDPAEFLSGPGRLSGGR